jgi:hypothetical protein
VAACYLLEERQLTTQRHLSHEVGKEH